MKRASVNAYSTVKDAIVALMRTVFVMAKEALPTCKASALINLQVQNGVSCLEKAFTNGAMYMHHDSIKDIYAALRHVVKSELEADRELSPFPYFGLEMDEATDSANKSILLQRKLGPGSYEINDFLQAADRKPRSSRGICQTKAPRFKEEISSDTPGPGTYGKGGIPHAAIEEKAMLSTSTVGRLDAGSKSRMLPSVGSELGPGTYNFNSLSDDLLRKITSIRGPYDLYSGDRNKPIMIGHLAAPKQANLGPGQYDVKSFLDDQETVHKKRQGKFGKVSQYPNCPTDRMFCQSLSQCPKDPNCPGPGKYDPQELSRPLSKNTPGFLSSAPRTDRLSQKFFTQNFMAIMNLVGAGRYDIQKWEESQHKNGHRSAFQSRTTKLTHEREKFLKERIRAKDVRLEDRLFIVTPEPAPGYSKSKPEYLRATTMAY